ncbi:carbonic anhydrase 2-like [Antedon mediterranea]|uniref:carbonic anhydrase 2-like n=1 Tax=Antedon mediterranea TaxID=105859 RepID=UPI003AF7C4C8
MAHHWGYRKCKKGKEEVLDPQEWGKEFPIAIHGKRQSPIDIKTSEIEYNPSLGKLKFDYDPKSIKNVVNNGHTFTVSVAQTDENDITGGPLEHKYELAQFHCHWGSKDDIGSEHTVNGKQYSAELHFVHWNTDLYKSCGDAIDKENGIAVLGTFIKVGEHHKYWDRILPYLNKVLHKGQSADIKFPDDEGFKASEILPTNTKDYYTYDGSLTTPPLYETVTWILFKEPVEISQKQMDVFRSLKSTEKDEEEQQCMSDNYRPTMAQHRRTVKASFK